MGQAKITDDGSKIFKKSPTRCNYKKINKRKGWCFYFQMGVEGFVA